MPAFLGVFGGRLLWGCVLPGTAEGGLLSVLHSGWGFLLHPGLVLARSGVGGVFGSWAGFPGPQIGF